MEVVLRKYGNSTVAAHGKGKEMFPRINRELGFAAIICQQLQKP